MKRIRMYSAVCENSSDLSEGFTGLKQGYIYTVGISTREVRELVDSKERQWRNDAGAQWVLIAEMPDYMLRKVSEGFHKEALKEAKYASVSGLFFNNVGKCENLTLEILRSELPKYLKITTSCRK